MVGVQGTTLEHIQPLLPLGDDWADGHHWDLSAGSGIPLQR
jgi:hypothetical protein